MKLDLSNLFIPDVTFKLYLPRPANQNLILPPGFVICRFRNLIICYV